MNVWLLEHQYPVKPGPEPASTEGPLVLRVRMLGSLPRSLFERERPRREPKTLMTGEQKASLKPRAMCETTHPKSLEASSPAQDF